MMNIDKIYLDDVDSKPSNCIPWYIVACLAKEEGDPIFNEVRHRRIADKILSNWEKIEHEYKELLTKENLYDMTFTNEYPKTMPLSLKQLRNYKNA